MFDKEFWTNAESSLLLNPRLPEDEKMEFQKLFAHAKEHFPAHVFIATSGSTKSAGKVSGKLVALSKMAMLNSAHSVNQHLKMSSADVIFNPLPQFHVGGLALSARAYLAECVIHQDDFLKEMIAWEPSHFCEKLSLHKVTVTSLVPTQVYDLVSGKFISPKSLRAVVVGGGALSKELYIAAKQLGWPVLPSYGMTETSSQVATAQLNDTVSECFYEEHPCLSILSHAKITITSLGLISINAPSLFSAYIESKDGVVTMQTPQSLNGANESFVTEDLGEIKGDRLIFLGRSGEVIKILGEKVNIAELERKISQFLQTRIANFHPLSFAIAAIPDPRREYRLIAFYSDSKNFKEVSRIIEKDISLQLLPFERIQETRFTESLPRTSLGKLKRAVLAELASKT